MGRRAAPVAARWPACRYWACTLASLAVLASRVMYGLGSYYYPAGVMCELRRLADQD